MKSVTRATAIALLLSAAGPVLAGKGGPPPPPPTVDIIMVGDEEISDDEFFIGINWQFGNAPQAELVAGWRDVDVQFDGDVSGFGVDMTFPLKDGFHAGELRFKGIDGDEDLQGEYGLGWSFFHKGFLFTADAQGHYFTLGADYVFGAGFEPFVGVNTIGGYNPPDWDEVEVRSCPPPFTLSEDEQSCLGEDDDNGGS